MSITTYAGLKTAVASRLARSDLTSVIPEFIEAGLQRINNELLLRGGLPDQEQVATAATVANQETLALPATMAMLRWIRVDSSTSSEADPLEQKDYTDLVERWGTTTGCPQEFAIEDQSFYLRPIPDAIYTVRICYVERYASLSGDSDTNFLLTNGGNVLLFAACAEAFFHIGDDARAERAMVGYSMAMEGMRIAARRLRRSRPTTQIVDPALVGRQRSNIEQGY